MPMESSIVRCDDLGLFGKKGKKVNTRTLAARGEGAIARPNMARGKIGGHERFRDSNRAAPTNVFSPCSYLL